MNIINAQEQVNNNNCEAVFTEQINLKDYSQLMQYIDNNYNKVEYLLDYNDFAVVYLKEFNSYWYFEQGENDCSECCQVELVAQLFYDINHDIQLKQNETLDNLFDCDYCGEYITDDNIQYLWFKELKGE